MGPEWALGGLVVLLSTPVTIIHDAELCTLVSAAVVPVALPVIVGVDYPQSQSHAPTLPLSRTQTLKLSRCGEPGMIIF